MSGLELDGGAHDLLRPRELQEVGDDVPERLGFLTDAVDVGPVGRRQRVGANQAAVAVNRREPVAELVGDAGGELAHTRQRFLQPQLLLELDRPA